MMPLYEFTMPRSERPENIELPDDRAAWGEAVTLMGELLTKIDGKLKRRTDWKLNVTEGERAVATIEIKARLHSELLAPAKMEISEP